MDQLGSAESEGICSFRLAWQSELCSDLTNFKSKLRAQSALVDYGITIGQYVVAFPWLLSLLFYMQK